MYEVEEDREKKSEIKLDIPDDLLFEGMKMAHELNITFNHLIKLILLKYIEEYKQIKKTNKKSKVKKTKTTQKNKTNKKKQK